MRSRSLRPSVAAVLSFAVWLSLSFSIDAGSTAIAGEPPAAASAPNPPPVHATGQHSETATAKLLARLDEAARTVNSLSGEFRQSSRLKLFKQELLSTGRFFFERPRRVRWEYREPDPSTLVLDGEVATLSTPGSAPQVFDLTRDATMRAVFDQIFLWLGAGQISQSREQYEVSSAGESEAPSLGLKPRVGSIAAKTFRRVELRFDKRLLLSSILLVEASGDEKEIVFTRIDRNVKLPVGAFDGAGPTSR